MDVVHERRARASSTSPTGPASASAGARRRPPCGPARRARPRRGRRRGSRPACRRPARRSPAAPPRSKPLGVLGRAQDRALDEVHHVEGGAVHRLVLAEPDHGRDRDRRLLERRDHPVLAAHVVGGAEPLSERRPAQRPGPAVGVADAEGEVRATAGDPVEARAAARPRARSPRTSPRRPRGRCPRGRRRPRRPR